MKNIFRKDARWKALIPLNDIVRDPTENSRFCAPTVCRDEVPVVQKHHFKEVFTRPKFGGEVEVDVLGRFKNRKGDKQTKIPIRENAPLISGWTKPEFGKEHDIDHKFLTNERFEPLVPIYI